MITLFDQITWNYLICFLILIHTELLERVLFRLGTTETDEQLETTVNKFLTPVLIKITSPNESVRCKVHIQFDSIKSHFISMADRIFCR